MKFFAFALVATLGLTQFINLNDVITSDFAITSVASDKADHHTCSGNSGLGGSCSATCTDSQSCACSTGVFHCSCACSVPGDGGNMGGPKGGEYEIAPKAKWDLVARVLAQEKEPAAIQMSREVMEVYSLARTSPEEFQIRTQMLEERFGQLPSGTIKRVKSALGI